MDCKSLMVNDWVFVPQSNGEIPEQIEGIYRGNISYASGYECGLYEVEPIKLTEEILKANGIKWSDSHCVFTDSHHFSFNREVNFGRVYNMDDDNHHEVKMPFKYVHELQHALRLCGLTELADNFKIC